MFSSVNSLRTCLKNGLGITVCPKVSITQDLETGNLVMLDWNRPEEEVPMIMLWHKEKWCSQILKDFMSLAENMMG